MPHPVSATARTASPAATSRRTRTAPVPRRSAILVIGRRRRAGLLIDDYERQGKPREQERGFTIGNDRAVRWYYLDYDKEWP
jgi:hypothetical protein